MKNQVFEDRIKHWEDKRHLSKRFFKVDGKAYKLIEIIDQITDIFASEPEVQLLDKKILGNFIDGLVLLRSDLKMLSTASKSKELTDPVFGCMRSLFSSVRMQKIINTDYVDGYTQKGKVVQFVITSKSPIPPENLIKNDAGFYEYKLAAYSEFRDLPKIIKTGILENLHEEFNGKIFKVTETDFIIAINDPVNFGELIKPLPGKQSYMYFLLGQISVHIKDRPAWGKQICDALGYDFEIYCKKKSGIGLTDDFINKVKSIIEK